MKIFEFVIIYTPPKEKDVDELKHSIIGEGRCLAKDESEARTHAAYAIPESYRNNLDRIRVCLRPF